MASSALMLLTTCSVIADCGWFSDLIRSVRVCNSVGQPARHLHFSTLAGGRPATAVRASHQTGNCLLTPIADRVLV